MSTSPSRFIPVLCLGLAALVACQDTTSPVDPGIRPLFAQGDGGTWTVNTHTAPPVGETGTVTWYLGDLLDQANEVAEIKVTVRIKGKTTIDNTASVTADIVDINPANNTATLKVSVGAGGKNK